MLFHCWRHLKLTEDKIWVDCTHIYFIKIMDVVWIQTGMYILLLLLQRICVTCWLWVLHLYKICKCFDLRTCVLVCGFPINGNLWFYIRALTLLEWPQSVFVFWRMFLDFFGKLQVIHILRFEVATLLILTIQVFLVVVYCLHLQRLRNLSILQHFKMMVKC